MAYVLCSSPHPRFTRRGSDLVHRVKLPLYQALVGGAVAVETLDGRVLKVPLDEIITPGLSITTPGEGMPKPTGGKVCCGVGGTTVLLSACCPVVAVAATCALVNATGTSSMYA